MHKRLILQVPVATIAMKKTERGDATQFTCVSMLETLDTPPWVAFELLPGVTGETSHATIRGKDGPGRGTTQKALKRGFSICLRVREKTRFSDV